jgi:microcystin-dependent protein
VSVGTIQIWFSSVIPADYLLCNGQAYSALTYPELFVIIGTLVVPDLRDRFIVGANSRLLKTV